MSVKYAEYINQLGLKDKEGNALTLEESENGGMPENGTMPEMGAGSIENTRTNYETVEDYIASLNTEEEWVTDDKATNTAQITSMEAFVKQCKTASKDVGAFDDLNCSQAENMLFGSDEQDAMHFDSVMASLLKDNQEKYAELSDWDAS